MTETANTTNAPSDHHGPQIRISVNGEQVVLPDSHMTGAEIKAAAMTAGVPIQPDFVLSEVRSGGVQQIIADDERIHVKKGDEFWAIPGDDNS